MEKNKLKILAIDDNKDNLISVKALIEEVFPDSIVLTATDGGIGIELAESEDPQVILLDVVMPGMDGFEVCQKLKSDPKTRDIPVIFLTALKGDKESRIRALEVGAEAFLAKPIDEIELSAQIRAMQKIKAASVLKKAEKETLSILVAKRTRELELTHASTMNLLEDLKNENETRRKSEEALRESEDRLSTIFKANPTGLFIVHEKTRIIDDVNDSALETIGLPRGDVVGQVCHRFLCSAEMGSCPICDLGQEVDRSEHVLLKPDGTRVPILKTVVPIRLKGENYLLESFIDITERKQAEEALRESEELFSLFLKYSPIYAYIKNVTPSESRNLRISDNFQDMLGIPVSEMVGKTMDELFPADLAAKMTADDWAVVSKGVVLRLDEDLNGRHYSSIKFPITQGDKTLLAGYSIDITERKQAELLQDALYRIAQAADQGESLDALYPAIHAIVKEIMVADNFYFAIHDGNRDILSFPYSVDQVDPVVAPAAPGKSLTAYVLRTAKPLLCDVSMFEELKQRGEVDLIGAHSEIWLGVPLLVDGKAIGVMCVQDYKNAAAYGERELRILEFVSSQAAVAIHRKQAEKELREAKALFETVVENIPLMLFLKEAEDLRFVLFNKAGEELLGYDRQELLGKNNLDLFPPEQAHQFMTKDREVLDGEAGMLDIPEESIQTGKKGQRLLHTRKVSIRGTDGITKYLLGISEDITEQKQEEEKLRESEQMHRATLETSINGYWLVDMQGSLLEVNQTYCRMSGYTEQELLGMHIPDLEDKETLSDTAFHIQKIMEQGTDRFESRHRRKDGSLFNVEISVQYQTNKGGQFVAFLQDITDRKTFVDKLRKTVVGTVNTIALIVEARDPYTSGHQKRVAEISVAIAKELGLPEEQIQGIYFASLIHDLGKIQVPSEILSKPGKLTRLEFDLIKTHARIGYELLREIEFPWPIAEMVYQHHERMDGSGYPRKLKGNRISIEAKIIGMADVIEAISSHRPYRPALGLDFALDEINKNKGILYDPEIVETFIKVIKKDKTLIPSP